MALIDKASLLFVPSVVAEGKAFNVLPSGNRAPDSTDQNSGYDQTRADFDFDRGSNAAATRIGSDGLIKKYRENVLTYSNQFNTSWSNVNTTETSGQEGYDGTNNAWKLVGNTNASRHYLNKSISKSGINTWSLYAKASGHSYVQFGSGSTANQYANFDLSDGSVGNIGSDFFSAIAEDVGNGWYRLSVVDKVSTNGFYISLVSSKSAAWLESWTMDNATDGIYIQSAQLESGLVATDYLDSTSVTAKAGVLVDLPRINYDANGENGALLLEPSRQNLIPQTEYLNGISWSGKIGTSFDTNTTTSPEGLENSALLKEDSSNGSHFAYKDFNLTNGSTYTISIFAKSNGANRNLRFGDGGVGWSSGFNGVFNLTDGTATGGDIESMGDGWYRCSVTGTTNATTSRLIIYSTLGTATSYQGDGSSGVFLYGFQLEVGAYATSYIPNHGESGGVTRAADSCLGTGASDVIGQTEGTIFAEIDSSQFLTGSYIGISDGGTSNRQIFGWEAQSGDSGTLRLYGFWNGFAYSSFSKGQKIKVALAYKNNDFALYVNGTQAGTKTNATISGTLSQFAFNSGGGAQNYQGNVYQTALFNEALSDSELATLTTL